jgi:hypothetical protein
LADDLRHLMPLTPSKKLKLCQAGAGENSQVFHSQLDDAGAFAPGWRILKDFPT